MEFDYHSLRLFDARDKICDDIIEAYENGCSQIQLIHGYKNGSAIRSYIWGLNGLRKDLKNIRPEIAFQIQKGSSQAVTCIILEKK